MKWNPDRHIYYYHRQAENKVISFPHRQAENKEGDHAESEFLRESGI
jgi:hypothetical protein